MHGKQCGFVTFVKSGHVHGAQRYPCQAYGRNYHGHSSSGKASRAEAEKPHEPLAKPLSGIVQSDEIWHVVHGKNTRLGSSGGRLILWHGEPCPGS